MPVFPPLPGSGSPLFVNPYIPAGDWYQPTEAYISVSEYINSDASTNTENLDPGGTPVQNTAVLFNKIAAASAWADLLCHQTLAATVDNETATDLYVHRDGTIRVNLRYWPLQQLNSFNVGATPSTMGPISDQANIWMAGRTTLVIPVGCLNTGLVPFGGPVGGWRPGRRIQAQWQYVNGWPLATLTAEAMAGDTVLHVSNTLAFYPQSAAKSGMYKIFDAASGNPETVVVSAVDPVALTLTLASPTQVDHPIPAAPDSINVSGMPDNIKQGVCFLTTDLLKAKGAEAIELVSIGGTQERISPTGGAGEGSEDFVSAVELLSRYDRVAL